ncbi:hypothetical protein R6Q57_029347 [Mikania cordata]
MQVLKLRAASSSICSKTVTCGAFTVPTQYLKFTTIFIFILHLLTHIPTDDSGYGFAGKVAGSETQVAAGVIRQTERVGEDYDVGKRNRFSSGARKPQNLAVSGNGYYVEARASTCHVLSVAVASTTALLKHHAAAALYPPPTVVHAPAARIVAAAPSANVVSRVCQPSAHVGQSSVRVLNVPRVVVLA